MQDEHNGSQFKSEFYQKTFQRSIAKSSRPPQQQMVGGRVTADFKFVKTALSDHRTPFYEVWSSPLKFHGRIVQIEFKLELQLLW